MCITNAVRKGSQNLGKKKPIKYIVFAPIHLQIDIVIVFLTKCRKEKWIERASQYKIWVAGDNK